MASGRKDTRSKVASGLRKARMRHYRNASRIVACLLLLAFTGTVHQARANATDEAPAAFRHVIDLCTQEMPQVDKLAAGFAERGWIRVEDDIPQRVVTMLADAQLLIAFESEELAAAASVNLETGEMPDISDGIETLKASVKRGAFDAYWHAAEDTSFVSILNSGAECNYYSDARAALEYYLEARSLFVNQPGYPARNVLTRTKGPLVILTDLFFGGPDHKPLGGFGEITAKYDLALDRPIENPQIGAGASNIWLYYFDTGEFVRRFNREPKALFLMTIERRPDWSR